MAVGSRAERAHQRRLPVSLRMVSRVVEQGQWNRHSTITARAVHTVHPWESSRLCSSVKLTSVRAALCR